MLRITLKKAPSDYACTGLSRGSKVGAKELPGLTGLSAAGSAHFDGYQLPSLILRQHWKRYPVRCPLHFLSSSPVEPFQRFSRQAAREAAASSPPSFGSSMLRGKHGEVA